MWSERETVCLVQAIIVLGALFYQQLRYKGERVSWKGFLFVYLNLALQISAFLILPLDFMNAEEKDGAASSLILRVYWRLFYWVNFFSSL